MDNWKSRGKQGAVKTPSANLQLMILTEESFTKSSLKGKQADHISVVFKEQRPTDVGE